MSATAPRTLPDATGLRARLGALRRRMRLVAAWRGAAWLSVVVLGALVVGGMVDYFFPLYALARAVVLVAAMAGAGLVAWRCLVQPLAQPADDLSLALRIEERHPTLNDALASTVQFLDQEHHPDGESAGMRREAVRRAMGRVSGLDFTRIVDSRGLRRATVAGGVLGGICLVVVLVAPTLASTAFWRLATPFSSAQWPRQTTIQLDDLPTRIGRSREYRITGTITGVVPARGEAVLWFEGLPMQKRAFAIRPDDEGRERFLVHLKPDEVQKNFRFSVRANDAESEERSVEVMSLPQFAAIDGKLTPQLTLVPPRYTDLPSPQRLSSGQGAFEAMAGTTVTVRGGADRPLAEAWVSFETESREAMRMLPFAAFAAPDPLGVAGTVLLAQSVTRRVMATLDADEKGFTVRFVPPVHGLYTIHIQDKIGLENHRQYEMRRRMDPAPVVKLDRPVAASVLADAVVPLAVVAEDTQFAVRSAWLEYRVGDAPARQMLFYHHAAGLAADAGGWLGGHARVRPAARLRLTRLEIAREFSLRRVRRADGSPLKEGDVVQLQACADDFDDVTPGKEPGRSSVVELRVVSRTVMKDQIRQEEGKIQNDLAKLRDRQREAMARVKEIEKRLKQGGKISPEREAQRAEAEAQKEQDDAVAEEAKAEKATVPQEKARHKEKAEKHRKKAAEKAAEAAELKKQAAQLAEAIEAQQDIKQKIGNEEQGLRAEVQKLRDTLKQNGMENSSAMERARMVARELERLAEQELDRIEPRLADARRMAEMQDEQTRRERMAELEARAAKAEREAKALREQAARTQERASRAEKAGREEEAKRAREEAMAQLEQAKEKKAEAEKARADARKPFDPDKARQAMADARKGQDEVQKTLESLLQELEPTGSTREVKNEAARLRKEQAEAMAQLEEPEKKKLLGKNPEELNQEEKAELEAMEDRQQRLAERAQQLMSKMRKVAEDRREKDPKTAEDLDNARKEAEKGNLQGAMKDAAEAIKKNKLNEAKEKQREAMAQLDELAKNLEDKREQELDRLIKKLKEAEAQVEKLMDEQEALQKKMREAEKKKDEAELKRLAKQQKRLKEKAEEVMKQLSRARSERARQALGAAGEEMGEAGRELSRGKGDDDKQEDVLDRLEEARREIEKARKKAEDELGREQLARIADTLKAIRERQQGHIEEAGRIQKAAQQRKGWSRGLKSSLLRLGDGQTGLGEETASVTKKELAGAPVFSQLLEQVARDMGKAGRRAGTMGRRPPPLEALPDADLDRYQQTALRKLNQLMEAIKEQSQNDPRPVKGGGGGDEEPAGGGGARDGLPPLAQLKLLKAMQQEVNKKTEEFKKQNPDLDALTPQAKADLAEIQREQREVGDLLERMTRPPGEAPDMDVEMKKGEKKEEKK